jgi:isoleucyl-tRNA synthetase
MMRHGEAVKNTEHIIDQGQTASPLTDAGRAQVRAAAASLKKQLSRTRAKLAAIVASPLPRAQETAKLVAKELGIKTVRTDERLREIDLGPSLVGCHDTAYHEAYPTYESKFSQRPPGGESLSDLRTRMWGVARELDETYAGANVLVVGHEYPLWMLADAARGWSMAESIAEKERRGSDFLGFAAVEPVSVLLLPRDEHGNVDPHRPYVDDIVLKRGRTKLYRVPELCDVWFDSGAMPYAQWHWPFDTAQGGPFERTFTQQFPADFISEAVDQTRGWFYTLLAVSTALGLQAPYRNVVSLGHVLDEKGQKMSKSKGNVVVPDDVFAAVGVDATRWYFYTVNEPGDTKNFSMKEVRERLTGFIGTLENCVRFWELGSDGASTAAFSPGDRTTHPLDRWILSRLHRLIGTVGERLERFDALTAARAIESFVVDDLSQWWLRRSRKRSGSLGLLRHVLLEVDKLIAPFVPFMAEDIHQRLHAGQAPGTLSVHLHDWPSADEDRLDATLEAQMDAVRAAASAGLAVRKTEGVRVRQPLASVSVPGPAFAADLEDILREELNVKEVRYAPGQPVMLDLNITPALRAEGWVRETIRSVQDLRKEAGLTFGQRALVRWHTDDAELGVALEDASATIAKETSSSLHRGPDQGTLKLEREFEFSPGKKLWLGLR